MFNRLYGWLCCLLLFLSIWNYSSLIQPLHRFAICCLATCCVQQGCSKLDQKKLQTIAWQDLIMLCISCAEHALRTLSVALWRYDNNNNNWLHIPAQVLGVCGPSPVSPGWLVLSVTVRAYNVQLLKVRQDNVIPDVSRPTWGFWIFDLTKQHDLGQSTV